MKKSMIIQYYRRNVYGNELIYIANDKTAATVYRLTGRKTITKGDIEALEALGFQLEEVIAPTAK